MASKKELIVKAFSEMNLSLLEVILDDKNNYHDFSKKRFLHEIEKVFKKFEISSDTLLTPLAGKCNSTSCPNQQCSGISFVGASSKNHLDLIFEESENDVTDIYDCINFKIDDQTFQINKAINLEIPDHDDSAPF